MREGFDKIWTILIKHLKANKGELRLILRVLKFYGLFASKRCFIIVWIRILDSGSLIKMFLLFGV